MSLVLASGFFTTSAIWEAPGGVWAIVYSLCLDKNGVQEGIKRDMKQKGDWAEREMLGHNVKNFKYQAKKLGPVKIFWKIFLKK